MAIFLDCKLHIPRLPFSDGGARKRIPTLGGVWDEMMSSVSFQARNYNYQAYHFYLFITHSISMTCILFFIHEETDGQTG